MNTVTCCRVNAGMTDDSKTSHDWFESAKHGACKKLVNLIEAGADVNSANLSDGYALMIAADEGNSDSVKLLTPLGADVNQMNEHSRPALTLAAKKAT